jgi:endonuclease-3 related protein
MQYTAPDSTGQKLMEMFRLLLDYFGPQHWWPGDTVSEIMIGAILTQNTNWKNVEKAIENLKSKGLLSVTRIHSLSEKALAEVIRPAGYFNIKARRLKNLASYMVERYEGNVSQLLMEHTQTLRQGLLSIKGIGPETADSILLYAAKRPVFVIDAYTYRILYRHGMAEDQAAYDELQALFMDHLPEDTALFNEFHALVVRAGKQYCRKRSLCDTCPLEGWETPHSVL